MIIRLTADLVIMFILAILVCGVSSLLTFQGFQFYSEENIPGIFSFFLQDENSIPFQDEIIIYIQVEPLIPFYILPFPKCYSTCAFLVVPSNIGLMNFKFSCPGCEIYTTSYIEVLYAEKNIITLEPSTTVAKINQKISINFGNNNKIQFSKIYLLTGEEVDYTITNSEPSSGVVYVTFLSCGEKILLFYFEDFTMTNIGEVKIDVASDTYSFIMFTSSIV